MMEHLQDASQGLLATLVVLRLKYGNPIQRFQIIHHKDVLGKTYGANDRVREDPLVQYDGNRFGLLGLVYKQCLCCAFTILR